MDMKTFCPIPSLDNKYEINKKGEVRRVGSKTKLSPQIYVEIDGKRLHRNVNSLLTEVFGLIKKDIRPHQISVWIQKGKDKIFFESCRRCAKFLAKETNYASSWIVQKLHKREKNIFGWKIKYDDGHFYEE